MTEIEVLVQKLASFLHPHALWNTSEVAAYLHRDRHNTAQHIVRQPGFPAPLRIPTGRGEKNPQPLWRAKDVIAWAESHVDS